MNDGLLRAVDRAGWADAVGEPLGRAISDALGRGPVKDFLNGRWLGHPLHPALTDLPVGALVVATALDLAGEADGADAALLVGIGGMTAAAAAGIADYADTAGTTRRRSTVHAALMTSTLGLALASLGLRLAGAALRPLAVALSILSLGTLTAGAWLGGEIVYGLGNGVDRHAWYHGRRGWRRLAVGELLDGTPTRADLEGIPLVLVRDGGSVRALHDTCAHAGGPLSEGRVSEGCIVCPWHGSTFRLTDGHVVGGPSSYDQPAFEVRATSDGGWEARALDRPAG